MSILDAVTCWCQEGRLIVLRPYEPASIMRVMVLTREIYAFVTGPWDTPQQEDRGGTLRADLEAFILGQMISVAQRPYKAKRAYMAQLHPPREQVWEIRSRDPKPSLRVFGRFAATDFFIALTFSERQSLGEARSRQWRDARERCKTEWHNLFPTYEPIQGDSLYDYISQNVFYA